MTVNLKKELLHVIENGWEKITPWELRKQISQKYGAKRKEIETAIKNLVSKRRLTYTYYFGRTFIEKSFDRAVRISRRVVLKPQGRSFAPDPDDVIIEIAHGASFGTGEHPTTRLAIRGIEHALGEICLSGRGKETCVLDIGTGSGVLAIAAVRLGISSAVGLDTDPCARYEAGENARLNGLEERFNICEVPVEYLDRKFILITANLRYPTLKRILSAVAGSIEQGGAVVLSGIKRDEISGIIDTYNKEKGFRCTWKECEKDWACLGFLRTGIR
ncbi:MAG: 50S ribosomal protein L11 methyltransferase [Deltaproteobacteria bacterium]|jgi:ribosomal protein L11 methyltransferase|nr:50S ribosomal protein L11 methyltransferase [Deltaproteobacteria bacterium]